ncbi:MAG: anaerobic sulfatase maturase [Candidatus Lokiarchaeota archaeon]
MKPFQLLIKPNSFDCNLRCEYCFYLRVKEVYPNKNHPRMNERILKRIISQYLEFRFPESIFGWQGGEPTLSGLQFFQKVVELQQKYGSPEQVVGNALQTNGVLITEEWAKFLHKYKFLIGLSLDGPKSVHDRYRKSIGGKSVWTKVMNTTDLFKRYQVEFNILSVVSRANVNRVKEVYKFYIYNGFHHLQFIPALEADEKGKRAFFSISSKQYGKFLCDLFDHWKENPNLVSIRLFDSLIAFYLGYDKGFCSLEKECAPYLLIEWNGDVYPCDFFAKNRFKVGNIMDSNLTELEQKREAQFLPLKRTLSEECKRCKWLELCYGGCLKDRLFPSNPHPKKTYYCEAYKMFFKHSNKWFEKNVEKMK